MGRAMPYYRGVRGSRALTTATLGSERAVARAEALAPGEMRRVEVEGDLLGAVRIRSRYVPVPIGAFDRAAPRLRAEEQAAWLHLLRLSYGEGRNFCRAGKRELMARLGLSERRLLRILAALVEKGFARPVHRDNRGTLWRVYLPEEALGEPLGDEVLLGRAGPGEGGRAAEPAPPGAAASAAARPARTARGPVSLLALAESLCRARGREPTREAMEGAAAEVAELLAEGHSGERVLACIRAIARQHGRARAAEEVAP